MEIAASSTPPVSALQGIDRIQNPGRQKESAGPREQPVAENRREEKGTFLRDVARALGGERAKSSGAERAREAGQDSALERRSEARQNAAQAEALQAFAQSLYQTLNRTDGGSALQADAESGSDAADAVAAAAPANAGYASPTQNLQGLIAALAPGRNRESSGNPDVESLKAAFQALTDGGSSPAEGPGEAAPENRAQSELRNFLVNLEREVANGRAPVTSSLDSVGGVVNTKA